MERVSELILQINQMIITELQNYGIQNYGIQN
jgi:hypothetical protein